MYDFIYRLDEFMSAPDIGPQCDNVAKVINCALRLVHCCDNSGALYVQYESHNDVIKRFVLKHGRFKRTRFRHG